MKTNEKLKEYLKEHGITQAFLVKNTNLNSVQICKILNGKRRISADELSAISKALKVSPEVFF